MKNKTWFIRLSFVVIVYFMLSLCDFMYIPADRYPRVIREIFFSDNENVTVQNMGNVCQVDDGIYFLYQGELMYVDNEGKTVKKVYSDIQPIYGIMKHNSDIFFVYKDTSMLYKINAIEKIEPNNETNGTKLLIKDGGDRYYTDGKYIYFFNNNMLNKYTLKGRKAYSSKVYYTPRQILGIGSTVFNGYSICINGYKDPDAIMGVDIPCYYLFGWNRVKHKQKRLGIIHYYEEASPWDRHLRTLKNIEEHDEWVKNLDYEIRTFKICDYRIKGEDTLEAMKDRNMEEYELVSIELYDSNPNFYKVVDGYVYFTQQLEISYRDKHYKEKITFDNRGNVSEKERDKIEFKIYPQAMLRVKLENIENAREGQKLDYEVVNIQRYIKDFIDNYEINDNFIYGVSNSTYTTEEEKIKVFITDMNMGTTTQIYSRDKKDEDRYMPELFCSDNYVFLYEYSNKEGEKACRITRFDRDGKNPTLIVDYTGEVVMKPLESVQ